MVAERLDQLEQSIAGLTVEAAVRDLRASGDLDQQCVEDLLSVAGRRAHSDATIAKHALDIGVQLGPDVGYPEVEPAANYLRARMTLNNGRPEEALELISKAKSGWLSLDRRVDAYRTELGRMHVLDDLGRHGEAVLVSEALLEDLAALPSAELSEDDGDQLEWIRAAATENLGVACGFTGQHQRALDAYRAAEERYESVGGTDDMARCRGNRGVELVAIGRALEGLEVSQSAAAMFEEIDDRLSYAQCVGQVADAELLLGLYAAALTRYEEARLLLDGLEARSESCRVRLRTVRAYLALNLVEEAAALATTTEEELSELSLQHDLAEARWLCAVAQLRAGRPAESISRLDLAIEGATASEDPPLLIKVLLTKSEALGELGDHFGAVRAGSLALAAIADGDWPTEELHVELRMAQLLTNPSTVEDHLRRAEELADELALPHLRYPVLLELGRHLRRHGGDDEARQWLESAVEVVEGLRGLIPDEAVRTSYLEGRTAAHVDLMSMLIAGQNEQDDLAAFDLAEASKARTLSDILAGVVQPNPEATDGTSSTLLARYEADLYAAYSALSSGGVAMSRARRKTVHDRAIELEQTIRLTHLQTETHQALVGGDPLLGQVPERPSRTEQIVEYHVVGEQIVAFVWSGGQLRVVTNLAKAADVSELVNQWDRLRQRFDVARQVDVVGQEQLVPKAEETLHQLWLAVFEPVARHLDPDDENVVVIPHGPLHTAPFHAMRGPDGPVGQSRTVAIAPSYAVAAHLRSPRWKARHGRSLVLGIADDAAPAAAAEAGFVADSLPGSELLVGQQGTLQAFTDRTQQPLDVIHLACHGLHRARNPMFSALKLADGWLTARDVLSLKLDGTLVVLSACESGRQGGQGPQDEAIGLARSFLAAGASAVVVSLWLAGDAVTSELMHHFYRELIAGGSPAAALRSAQALVAAEHSHPAAWAPFVIHGGIERPAAPRN